MKPRGWKVTVFRPRASYWYSFVARYVEPSNGWVTEGRSAFFMKPPPSGPTVPSRDQVRAIAIGIVLSVVLVVGLKRHRIDFGLELGELVPAELRPAEGLHQRRAGILGVDEDRSQRLVENDVAPGLIRGRIAI